MLFDGSSKLDDFGHRPSLDIVLWTMLFHAWCCSTEWNKYYV